MADLHAEMLKVAEEVATGEGAEAPAPVQEGPAPEVAEGAPDGQEAAQESASELEEAPEEKGEAEEAKSEAEPKTEDEKPNSSYQRLNRKFQETQVQLKKAKDEAHEALVIANEWRARGIRAVKEMQRVISEAQRFGYRRDPRDDRILAHEMREQSQGVQSKAAKVREEQVQNEEVQTLAAQYTEDAKAVAKRFPGLTYGEILRGHATMVESFGGEQDVSMEEVAKLLHGYKNRGQGPRAQLEKNRSAVQTIKPGGPVKPREYKPVNTDMAAFLRDNGLA